MTSDPSSSSRALGQAAWWSGWAALLVLQVVLISHFVPLRLVLSDEPLRGQSYERHARQVIQTVSAMQRSGHTWFYDIRLLAGQAEGTVTDLDSKAWELWTFGLSSLGVPSALAFNSFVLLVMLLAPFCGYAAARSFELSPARSLIAAWIVLLLWFFDSYLHWLWFVGSISWCGAACLSLIALACFQRWLIARRTRDAVYCGASVALALLFHGASALTIFPPIAVSYLVAARTLSRRERLVPLLIVAVALAPNTYWIVNLVHDWQLLLPAPTTAQAFPSQLLCDLIEIRCPSGTTGEFGTRSGLRVLCLLVAIAGLYVQRTRVVSRSTVLLSGLALCYAIAYLGFAVPGARLLHPYQQLVPALLLTSIPAAFFLGEAAPTTRQLLMQPRFAGGIVLALAGVFCKQTAWELTYFLPELVPPPKQFTLGVQPPVSQYGYIWPSKAPTSLYFGLPHRNGPIDEIVRWLETHVPRGARILVGNATLGERLARAAHFEVLGGESGPWPSSFKSTPAASLRRWFPGEGNQDLASEYLRAYAVEWVVVDRWTLRAATRALSQVATVSGERIYRSQVVPERILQGGGEINASADALEVTASNTDVPLVLSYHWHPSLRCKPDCRVERVGTDLDSVGFIGVPAPHATHLTVWNSYAR
jgi:hypothetical protein